LKYLEDPFFLVFALELILLAAAVVVGQTFF
jgi:hypothetical protein